MKRMGMVEEKFGPMGIVMMVKNLQSQADVHSTKIIDLFQQHFHINKIVEDINNQKRKEHQENIDPR